MDLTTTYMGFKLPHPLIPGASPMVDNLDTVRRLEDAGAPMIIMHSIFEEQITSESMAANRAIDLGQDSYAEALSYLPEPDDYCLGPDDYLEQIRKLKATVAVPIIGSLNGANLSGWLKYAKLIQQAGADGLELNIYELATDSKETGVMVEERAIQIVQEVRHSITIPLAVKLSPFYSSLANLARRLDDQKVDALVLFNRFYQPDIDIEELEAMRVNLSSSSELLLRLRWLAILSGRVQASLGCTGGVHTAVDAIKAIMTGAHGVQMVSALLQRGPDYLRIVRQNIANWMEKHEYESLLQMQGSMNLLRCPDPKIYERANYMQILLSWQG